MITTAPAPYREPEDKTLKWLMIFIALSLLLHAILFTAIFFFSRYVPAPKFAMPEPPKENKIALTLLPPPPAPKTVFIPTQPQANAPHVIRPIESANDTQVASRSKSARAPDSILPDVQGKKNAPDMRNSPEVRTQKTPQPSTTPPTPRQAQPQTPSPPTPQPQMAQRVQPRPLPPQPKPAPPKPPQPQQQQIDPNTGLPVLPPINAQTMAPQNQSQPLAPAPSQQQVAGDSRGAIASRDDTSPAAMATDLGKYKQYVYSVVGSYWRNGINDKVSLIGVGVVTIRFTIHSDGTLTDVYVREGNQYLMLRDVSRNALVAPAPFKPFSQAMIKQVGDSFTEEYNFQIY